jgi:signal transduction histidine kinase
VLGSLSPTVLMLLLVVACGLGAGAAIVASRLRRRPDRAGWTEAHEAATIGAALDAVARAAGASTESAQLDAGLDMLVEVLRLAGEGSNQVVAAILLYDVEGWRIAAARRIEPGDRMRRLYAPSGSVLARAVSEHRSQISTHPQDDPCLAALTSMRGCASAACVPLLAGERLAGLLLAAHPQEQFFQGERLAGIEASGSTLAALHAQSRRLLDVVRDRERLTEIQEEWRKRLSRDLHDGPTQAIAAIAMQLNYAGRLLERDPAAARAELRKSEELARRTTREVRNTLFTLRPLLLESQGLVAAIAQLAEKEREAHGQLVLVDAEADVARGLNPDTQGIIFYLAEEAIRNARKHAQAEHTWVRLTRPSGRLMLEIEDDGVGFNVGSVDANYAQRGSLGMVTMRERAELVGGTLHVDSAEGRGTRIRVLLPLSEAEGRESTSSANEPG